ncbi:class I SAM-dependent methyltransferase [Thiolapillus sp.]|uniref:class I SAM-dependent methyltransferase n=1 Tax=Thiolapillus sp. TaxID=2017437 RepID=UPI003AF6D146
MQHLSETLEFSSEFRTLWLGHEELRQKMIDYIHSRVLSGYPEYVEQLVSRLDHLTMYTDLNDKQIFIDLGGHLYNEISDREEMHDILQEDNNKRANNRSQAILDLLTDDFLPGSVLDYGCHSGKILVELAETLNIPSAQRFGMDVAMPADCREFQFLLSDDTCSQFESGSLELIIALVVLHHLPRPREIIAEYYRRLRPGGRVVVREHDYQFQFPEMKYLFDSLHHLWRSVFALPNEMPNADNYYGSSGICVLVIVNKC